MNADIRSAWIQKVLAQMPSGLRILDAGAGSKQYEKFCSHLKYVSQDFCKYDGKGDGVGLHRGKKEALNIDIDIVCDITSIPEPSNSFDIILCAEVFEHIPNPIIVIQEFSRLLKSSGRLILTAPFCSMTHYAPYHYYSGFNRYFYEKFLAETGFEILSISTNGSFFEFLIQELRRIGKMTTRYTNARLSPSEKGDIVTVLKLLRRFCNKDKGSSEFLCFGYHILAKKL